MTRYLIVNADDFGLTEGVSRGILRAYIEGILTSTTFMVNFPWAAEMASLLQGVPDLGVGIHLNLTTGSPVLAAESVPSLVDRDGRFMKGLLHLRFQAEPAEIRREWAAQIEKGISLLGRLPTHLDTHKYLQAYPGLAHVLLDLARAYKVPAVRCLYPDLVSQGGYALLNPYGWLFRRYLWQSAEMVRQSGIRSPEATLAGDLNLERLLAKLERVPDGSVTELVTHPGLVDDQLLQLSSLQQQRETELTALVAPEARGRVAALGLKLVTFRHLVG